MAHLPRKRFGQHFLHEAGIVDAIVRAIDPRPDDHICEIGPGLGALTRPLLARIPHMHAVEIDRDIVAALSAEFPPERLSLHEADALSFDFAALPAPLRLVGNLPYNISTPLLFHIASFRTRIVDATFMLQKEVVLRMVSAPRGPDYGRLSVMLQYSFRMERLFDVAPGAFRPPPRVDSSVVRLVPVEAPLALDDPRLFEQVVAAAFGQRRKTLRNSLGRFADPDALAAASIGAAQRAEEVPVEGFVALANALARRAPGAAG